MGQVYVGLDVGSSSCQLEAMDWRGTTLSRRRFATSEANLVEAFTALATAGKEVHVHLEAGELAGWIREVARPLVRRVVIGDPKRNAWIAKDPLKTDAIDAHKLADLLRLGRVHEVYYPDEAHRRHFKQVVQHYDDLAVEQSRLKVKIKARLRAQGRIRRGAGVFSTDGRAAVLEEVESPAVRQAIEQLYQLLDQMVGVKKAARQLMVSESRRYPEIRAFRTVPGVGLVGACRFSAYIQTPHRFSSKRKLWRYCGLGITNRSSDGKRLSRQRLDRQANGRLKDMSYKAYLGAMRQKGDNSIKRCYHRALARTHNGTHARLATQRKMLAVLRAMWITGEPYRETAV